MRNVRALVSYDGSRFFGWQRQDGFRSVQQELEEAVHGLVGEPVTVYGAGRTDTGVHAFGQVANFHVRTELGDDRLRHALNAHLSEGVVVRRLETCADGFHARFDACGKRYLYVVATTRFQPPMARAYQHWVSWPVDLERLRAAARAFEGEHDFQAFGNVGASRRSTVRRVQHVRVVARKERLAFVVQGTGFLYKMVRNIVGTLLDVGRGRLEPGVVEHALRTGDRRRLGATAPPEGLYLVSVRYPEPAFAGRERGPRGAPGAFQY